MCEDALLILWRILRAIPEAPCVSQDMGLYVTKPQNNSSLIKKRVDFFFQ